MPPSKQLNWQTNENTIEWKWRVYFLSKVLGLCLCGEIAEKIMKQSRIILKIWIYKEIYIFKSKYGHCNK